MNKQEIVKKMQDLSSLLEFQFQNIEWLAKAMCTEKINDDGEGKNHIEHQNDALATVGDTLLKFVIADKLYEDNHDITKKALTEQKAELECNEVLYKITNDPKTPIINYAYHCRSFYPESPKNDRVANPKKHTPYLEAIIGSIYYDSGYEAAKKWISEWLLPKIKHHIGLED